MITETKKKTLAFFFLAMKFEKDYYKSFRLFKCVAIEIFFSGRRKKFSRISLDENFFQRGCRADDSLIGHLTNHSGVYFTQKSSVESLFKVIHSCG